MKTEPTPSGNPTKPWAANVPAGFSDGDKHWDKRAKAYFKTKTEAANFCIRLNRWKDLQASPVVDATFQATDNDLHWIGYLRAQLPDLSRLPAIIEFWQKHGATPSMTLAEAVAKYIDIRKSGTDTPDTIGDVKSKLNAFSAAFPGRRMDEITATDIEDYQNLFPAGWSRKSVWKRVSQFFKYFAKRKLISINPCETLEPPRIEFRAPVIYTVEQVGTVLNAADKSFKDVAPALILQSFGYLRTAELVPENGSDAVLDWSNIDWTEKEIEVPADVAKKAKAEADNARYIPMNEALIAWLEPYKKSSGRIVTLSETRFEEKRKQCFTQTGTDFEDNAFRRSCISYSIANGKSIGEVAIWSGNSEATIKKHYKRAVKAAQGRAYFGLRRKP
jgi:site-specific recombinase XerD